MKKFKSFFKYIKSNSKTPRGKAIAFFGFYFIFFIVVIMMVRFNSSIETDEAVNSLSIYSSGSIYLGKDSSGSYVMIDNPYLFPELKDLNFIKKMLNKATYISTGNLKKTYQISTTTLVSIFDNQEIDLDDMPNTIVVTTNSDGQIYKLEYDFSSYSIYRGHGAYQGSLLYSNFSNVPEIVKPV